MWIEPSNQKYFGVTRFDFNDYVAGMSHSCDLGAPGFTLQRNGKKFSHPLFQGFLLVFYFLLFLEIRA